MDAISRTVANIGGADISVGGAGGACGIGTGIAFFVTGIVTFPVVRTWISGMVASALVIARLRAIAECPIVAAVVGVGVKLTAEVGIAGVVGTRIAVIAFRIVMALTLIV